jgi:hypothetical protein
MHLLEYSWFVERWGVASHRIVGFEVFTAVTIRNAALWDVAPCGFIINRRFG